jgi:antitoxin (DNA-binding transcriptional repressor) of toxin-antitoxin stability system
MRPAVSTITIEDAKTRLDEIIAALPPGEAVVITRDGQPVATLMADLPKGVPIYGRGKGKVLYMAPDFDEPLEDFGSGLAQC